MRLLLADAYAKDGAVLVGDAAHAIHPVAGQGFKLPTVREDIWKPTGESAGGATSQPAVIPKELSDTAWFTERGLAYLQGRAGRPWFIHLGY